MIAELKKGQMLRDQRLSKLWVPSGRQGIFTLTSSATGIYKPNLTSRDLAFLSVPQKILGRITVKGFSVTGDTSKVIIERTSNGEVIFCAYNNALQGQNNKKHHLPFLVFLLLPRLFQTYAHFHSPTTPLRFFQL